MATPDFDPALARTVTAETLAPQQQRSARRLRTAADLRLQWMLKHPHLSEFHSRAEHLHAALLEGAPAVSGYVPQPFRLRVRRQLYTPDCYVVSDAGPRRVVEIKPRGVLREELREPLAHFFAARGLQFEVISNESVFERETEAENWAEIVRVLHQSRTLETAEAEYAVLERLANRGPCTLGDLVDAGDRERTYTHEIALLRLVHRGHLRASLTERRLDFDTEIGPCT
ncbi:hypothetical protein [Halofilum ochraceum]|uniref:hypothetical protein n=1 Tax=Halofilum ochraceum TaxID=1611323 RepID=UPI0008D9C62A|nr:hypothetical protein [Halofilum ochraceum]